METHKKCAQVVAENEYIYMVTVHFSVLQFKVSISYYVVIFLYLYFISCVVQILTATRELIFTVHLLLLNSVQKIIKISLSFSLHNKC